MIITFIPPFLWGLALFLGTWFTKKHDGVWVTNMRLVDFSKVPFSKYYAVTSIPLGQIKKIRRASAVGRGFFTTMLDRLFGIDDLQVFVKDSAWVQCHIVDIKSPGKLIEYIRNATNAET